MVIIFIRAAFEFSSGAVRIIIPLVAKGFTKKK